MNDGENRVGAFDLARLRLARADDQRREELNRLIAAMGNRDDRGEQRCEDCHQQLPRGASSPLCKKCQKKVWMRTNRKPMTRAQLDAKNERLRLKRVASARAKLKAKGIEVKP